MGVNYNPKTITNGLVLGLDAGNIKSFNSGNTVWYDSSGLGNHATMYGSVPFSTDVVPCFDFATVTGAGASSASLGFTFASNMIPTTGNFTLSCWTKNISATNGQVGLFSNAGDGDGFRFGVSLTGAYFLIGPTYKEGGIQFLSPLSESLWYNTVMVFNRSSANISLYLNGTYQNMESIPVSQTAFPNTTPGLVRNPCCTLYRGKLSAFSAYNRSLSATEIASNFNALRGRYGI